MRTGLSLIALVAAYRAPACPRSPAAACRTPAPVLHMVLTSPEASIGELVFAEEDRDFPEDVVPPSAPSSALRSATPGMDHALLSAAEERALAEDIQKLRRDEELRRTHEAKLARSLTDDEWADASGCGADELQRQRQRAHAARRRLVEANLRLVAWVVQRARSARLSSSSRGAQAALPSVQDLVQEGVVGLMTAADRFDPLRARFATFAYFWVRAAVLAAMDASSGAPRPQQAALKRASENLERELARPPSLEELRHSLGRPGLRAGTVEVASRLSLPPASLDAPAFGRADGDGGTTVLDRVAAAAADDADDLRAALRHVLRAALAPRAAWLIEARYGLGEAGAPPLTREAAAAELGVSGVRVMQLEAAAIAALRKSPHSSELRDILLWRAEGVGADAPPMLLPPAFDI